ncbi:MAG: EAL domain-containing protein [Pseudomonadota bacterium]
MRLPMALDDLKTRIADAAGDGIVLFDVQSGSATEGTIVWCNAAAMGALGWSSQPGVGSSLDVFGMPVCDVAALREFQDCAEPGSCFEADTALAPQDGQAFLCRMRVCGFFDDLGAVTHWVFFLRDVTEGRAVKDRLKMAQQKAIDAQTRLRSAIDSIPDPVALYDSKDRLIFCNDHFRHDFKAVGIALDAGITFEEILRAGHAAGLYPDVSDVDPWVARRMEQRQTGSDALLQKVAGGRFLKVYDCPTDHGDLVSLRVDVSDVKYTEMALQEQRDALTDTLNTLEEMTRTDALTGLKNRTGLDLAIKEMQASRAPDVRVAYLHIDLDRFKPINDVFGHGAGDFVLCHVARVLSGFARAEDSVARIGGDEFALLLGGGQCATQDCADTLSARIIAALAEPALWQEKTLNFGACVGIATGTVGDLHRLTLDADIALQSAKSSGRSSAASFTPALRKSVEERKALADEFLHGLRNGEVTAYFQPQVDASTWAPCGAEALVRWSHPTRGVLAPNVFLPIAEDLGLSADVDALVFDEALALAQDAHAAGTPLRKISVNVSYGRLAVLSDLREIFASKPWPCQLSFELLEAIDFDEEASDIAWIVQGLRDLGIGIEIDDFGSGRASLTALLNIRPDRIKIDRRIVGDALKDDGAKALIAAVGEMARGLGMPMTAEGIETRAQADMMRAAGCDVLQGYFFAKALSRDDFLTWMGAQNGRVSA